MLPFQAILHVPKPLGIAWNGWAWNWISWTCTTKSHLPCHPFIKYMLDFLFFETNVERNNLSSILHFPKYAGPTADTWHGVSQYSIDTETSICPWALGPPAPQHNDVLNTLRLSVHRTHGGGGGHAPARPEPAYPPPHPRNAQVAASPEA